MGEKLTDSAEILFRQIHPDLIQDGVPASSGFRPKESDQDLLSVDRGSLTTAEQAHSLYTANGLASAAVYGVSVGEFDTCDLPCESDPVQKTDTEAANPAHAIAKFGGHGTSKQKTLGKRLKNFAVARGILHPTSEAATDD